MENRNMIHKKSDNLELTRDNNFIDGRMDMFDLLAARRILQEQERRLSASRQTGTHVAN